MMAELDILVGSIGIEHFLDDPTFRRWATDPDQLPHRYSYYDLQALRWGKFSGFVRHDKWVEFIGVNVNVLSCLAFFFAFFVCRVVGFRVVDNLRFGVAGLLDVDVLRLGIAQLLKKMV